jgi:hypothetical protein
MQRRSAPNTQWRNQNAISPVENRNSLLAHGRSQSLPFHSFSPVGAPAS